MINLEDRHQCQVCADASGGGHSTERQLSLNEIVRSVRC